jgi:hypothetical protein
MTYSEKTRQEAAGNLPDEVADRFWARVDRRGHDECWPWLGSKTSDGYGSLYALEKSWRATHLALILATGEAPPKGMFACHKCDNPPCVNPAHLFIGTAAENNADRHRKGRTVYRFIPAHLKARGERHGSAKLKEADVLAIAASGKSIRALASEYGVGFGTIQRIKSGAAWQHLSKRGLEIRETEE